MSERRLARWTFGAAGLVAAVLVGRWTAGARPEPATPSRVVVASATAVPMTAADRATMRSEIRAAVAAAMPASVAVPAGGAITGVLDSPEPGHTDREHAAPVEPTPAMRAADEAARRLVDEAIGRAAWSSTDWRTLEELAGEMAPDQRMEAFRRLAMAVNSRQIASLAPPVSGP